MNEVILQNIRTMIPDDHILENEDMDVHTSFRVGGPARLMLTVDDTEQLKKVYTYMVKTGNEFIVLGNGTNLLVSDKGYKGTVIKLGGSFADIKVDGDRIYAGAAALLAHVAREAASNSLSGMEFASGIPGSIGGAMVMNAGAYEGDMSMITETVQVMTPEGEELTLENATMEFGYRTSIIRKVGYIVTGVTLKLTPGSKEEIMARMNELAAKRRSTQPVEAASAGSTFKRPEGYYAGKLIMDAGLRGFSIGGAGVSEKHCGFVINKGYASAADVYDVICQVEERVRDRFGVKLEREVILLGDF